MSDAHQLPERRADDLPLRALAGSLPTESAIEGDGWQLYIDFDGWYLRECDAEPRRITVEDAVRRVSSRGQIFRLTRLFIKELASQLADEVWISPIASGHEFARSRGLDPKHPSAQIAHAGEIIARLGHELSEAEAAPLP